MADKPAALPFITPGKCTACGRCVAACPKHLLYLQPEGWVKSATLSFPEECDGCALCYRACPFGVIRMRRVEA